MSFFDEDEPSPSRRRRGRRRAAEDDFEDFWGRESVGSGRSRRKGARDDAADDLADLREPGGGSGALGRRGGRRAPSPREGAPPPASPRRAARSAGTPPASPPVGVPHVAPGAGDRGRMTPPGGTARGAGQRRPLGPPDAGPVRGRPDGARGGDERGPAGAAGARGPAGVRANRGPGAGAPPGRREALGAAAVAGAPAMGGRRGPATGPHDAVPARRGPADRLGGGAGADSGEMPLPDRGFGRGTGPRAMAGPPGGRGPGRPGDSGEMPLPGRRADRPGPVPGRGPDRTAPPGMAGPPGGRRPGRSGPTGPAGPGGRRGPSPQPLGPGDDAYPAGAPTAAVPEVAPHAWPDDEDVYDDAYTDDAYEDDAYYDEYGEEDDLGGDELDELPHRRGCRGAVVALVVLVVMAMVAGWFAWSWVGERIDPPGEPGEVVIVDIPEGTSTAGVGDVLAEAGVISDARVWGWYTRLRDVGTIKAGKYEMRRNSSFAEAIDDLGNEPFPPDSRLVTVPEGLTQAQLAERLTDPERGVPGFTVEGVEAALADPEARSWVLPQDQPLLEGTLFPETYAVEEGETEVDLIRRMVAQFDEVAKELQLETRAEAVGLSPYQVLIVASMIEREAGIPQDKPRIARVIYNRMEAGEALGIDATSCYEKGEIPCTLTTAELQDGTPYDTRDRPGLTPTPIASPGRASIEAALAPADGDWRWYVLDAEKNDGSSYFTNDYDDFLAAKQRCAEAGLGCG